MPKPLFSLSNFLTLGNLFDKKKDAYHTPPPEPGLSARKLLYNLAGGEPSRIQSLVTEYAQNRSVPSPDSLFLKYNNRAFSWLADLEALSTNSDPNLIKELTREIIVEHINYNQPYTLRSLKDCHEAMLRVIRVWSCERLLNNKKHKHIYKLALESSLKDVYSIKQAVCGDSLFLPDFLILEMFMILTLTRFIVHERQRPDTYSDSLLNTLSEKIAQTIHTSDNKTVSDFSDYLWITQKNYDNPKFSSWFNILSVNLDNFSDPDGYYRSSNDPTIHAHLFLWLFTTIEIVKFYDNIPPTWNLTLRRLFEFISPFIIPNKSPKVDHLDNLVSQPEPSSDINSATFLNIESHDSPKLSINEFLPPNYQTLLFYIEQTAANYGGYKSTRTSKKNTQNSLQSFGFSKINTKYLCLISFNGTPDEKKELYKENYALSPFLFFVATGNQSYKYPLFYKPSTIDSSQRQEYPSYLEGSGLGLSNAQEEPIPFNSLNMSSVRNVSGQTTSVEMNETIRKYCLPDKLGYLDIETTKDKLINYSIGETILNDYDLSICRKILISDKGQKLLGMDSFSPSARPRKQNLFYHISFLCPSSWIVNYSARNKSTVHIKQMTEKADYIWSLSLLDEDSEWQIIRVKGLGCWIFKRRQIPTEKVDSVNWLLSLSAGKRKVRSHRSDAQRRLKNI